VALCADENQMTTPNTIRKICAFFFTGLDRSRQTNLDLIMNATNVRTGLLTSTH